MLSAVGERLFVRLSPIHVGYARVRQLDGHRFYYDVEDPKPANSRGAWAAGLLFAIGEGRTWCRDVPEEIEALKVAAALA